MPHKHYRCRKCDHTDEEFFHTTEPIPDEIECPKCHDVMVMPTEDNLCASEQMWGHADVRVKDTGA